MSREFPTSYRRDFNPVTIAGGILELKKKHYLHSPLLPMANLRQDSRRSRTQASESQRE